MLRIVGDEVRGQGPCARTIEEIAARAHQFEPEMARARCGCARADRAHQSTRGGAKIWSSTLRDFASAAVQSKRIRFGDLRRLKRDIRYGGRTDVAELGLRTCR